MTDAEAGKRFKQFLKNLMQNRAPQGSLEERMLLEASDFSALQSKRIRDYWESKRKRNSEEPKKPKAKSREFTPPPSPSMERMNGNL